MCPSGQGRMAVADCSEVKYRNQKSNHIILTAHLHLAYFILRTGLTDWTHVLGLKQNINNKPVIMENSLSSQGTAMLYKSLNSHVH